MVTWLTPDSTDQPCVLVWVCAGLDESDEDLEQELTVYLAAKKYQVKAYCAACMVFAPRLGPRADEPSGSHHSPVMASRRPNG